MHFLISAGPTREFFDSVRYISNPSSGKMGFALARAAHRRGHEVTLIAGPVAINPPKGVNVIDVVSAAEMSRACKRVFRQADVAIMTAAVCDYRPQETLDHKQAKKARAKRVVLEPTEDIAASLGKRKGKKLLIGFAMEDHDGRAHAERKLQKKNCDLIVLNGPGNVGVDDAEVEFYTQQGGWSDSFEGSKQKVANHLIRCIEQMRRGKANRDK